MTALILILVALVIMLCVWLNHISSRVGIPALLAFILLGVLFGSSGLMPVNFDSYETAEQICSVALIFMIFYGGFVTRWDSARPIVAEAGLLASLGVVITAGLTGTFCHFVLKWDWVTSLLLGAIMSSTDAASVFSILRSRKLGLKNNTAPLLEVESGSNDPCAHMLTVAMVSIMTGTISTGGIAWMIIAQLVFGIGLGLGIAYLARLALEKFDFASGGFGMLFILAVALASFSIPEAIGGNGFLSTYIVGVTLGNSEWRGKRQMVHFFDGFTGLMQVVTFFLLGLLAKPEYFPRVILPALAIFAFLTLVSRPMAVNLLLLPFRKFSFRQQGLISFVGLRGAASILFAMIAVSDNELLEHDFFNLVFCIVLLSTSIQGSLIPWLSKKLKMTDKRINVLQTFNDYSEHTELQFSVIDVEEGGVWDGRNVSSINFPRNALLALIIRNGERIIAKGGTVLHAGDKAILVTKTFEDTQTRLIEKKIKPGSRRIGHPIKDYAGDGLILLVRRGDQTLIPDGNTILLEGDGLVLLRVEKEA